MNEAQANRIIELLEKLVEQTAPGVAPPLLQRAGMDARVADIILGGPDELIRRNREERKARAAARRTIARTKT